MNSKFSVTVLLSSLAFGPAGALAHRPIFSDGSATGPDQAIFIDDISVSYAIYHEVTAEASQLWIAFDGKAGQEVFFRLGVPAIDRLADFRPVLMLLGPRLPAIDLPISAPEGLGGIELSLPDGQQPEFFYEEFTGTDSWAIGDLELNLPESGRYYAVAYVPGGQTGKLWIAPGRAEVFSLEDIISLPQVIERVRRFHEVSTAGLPCFLPFLLGIGVVAIGLRISRSRQNK